MDVWACFLDPSQEPVLWLILADGESRTFGYLASKLAETRQVGGLPHGDAGSGEDYQPPSRRAFSNRSGNSVPAILIRLSPPVQSPPCRPGGPSPRGATLFASPVFYLVGNARHVVSYRQHSNPASTVVYHDQGPKGQVGLMLIESGNDQPLQKVRQGVLRANL